MTSLTSDAANFLLHVKTTKDQGRSSTLDVLLKLPSLAAIARHVPDDVRQAIAHDYDKLPPALYAVAEQSRALAPKVQFLDASGVSGSGWRDDLNILLGVSSPPGGATAPTGIAGCSASMEENPPSESPGVTLVDAFNKIKHRFTVTDNLPAYLSPPEAGRTVFGRFGISREFVERLRENTITAARVMGEMAALMLLLDQPRLKL